MDIFDISNFIFGVSKTFELALYFAFNRNRTGSNRGSPKETTRVSINEVGQLQFNMDPATEAKQSKPDAVSLVENFLIPIDLRTDQSQFTKLSEGRRFSLSHLLASTPGMIALLAKTQSGRYKMVWDKVVEEGLKSGAMELTPAKGGGFRAIARATSGKGFEGHARIVANSGQVIAVAGAVWQIAAMVTGQKFLADIDKKLASLDTNVKTLVKWLHSAEQGQINGSHEYLKNAIHNLKHNDVSDRGNLVYAHQAEKILHESYQGIEANLLRVNAISDVISQSSPTSGIKSTVSMFESKLNELTDRSSATLCFIRNFVESLAVRKCLDSENEADAVHYQYLKNVSANLKKIIPGSLGHMENVITVCEKAFWSEWSDDHWDQYKKDTVAKISDLRVALNQSLSDLDLIISRAEERQQAPVSVKLIIEVDQHGNPSVAAVEDRQSSDTSSLAIAG